MNLPKMFLKVCLMESEASFDVPDIKVQEFWDKNIISSD